MARRKKTEEQTVKKQTTSSISSIANQNIKKKTGYSATASGKTSQITEAANREIKSRQQNARVKEYLEGIKQRKARQESFNKTLAWKEAYRQAQYSPNGDQSYLVQKAKLMADNPGSVEKEARRETKKWQDLSREAQYGYDGQVDPSMIYAANQMGASADQTKLYLDSLQQARKQNDALNKLTYQGMKADRQQDGTGFDFGLNKYIETQRQMNKNKKAGLNDVSNIPRFMSDEGLEKYKQGYQNQYDQKMAEIQGLNKQKTMRDTYIPWQGWGNQVYDYIHDLGIQNEDAILNGTGYTDEEKRNAWWTKTEMQDAYQAGRDEALEDARIFYNDQFVGGGYAGTQYDQQMMRELAYENIMGEKYADRVARMTPAQKNELDSRIDQAIGGFTNPYDNDIDYDAEMQSRAREAAALQKQVNIAEEEQTGRGRMKLYAQQAAQMGLSATYDPTIRPETKMVFDDMYQDDLPMPQGTNTDKAYYWANEYQNYDEVLLKSYTFANKYMFVRALGDDVLDQLNTFYKFDKQNGTRSADSFLQALDPYLTTCLAEFQDWYMREKAENPISGIPARIMSTPMNTVSGIIGTVGTVAAALGVESAQDKTSGWYSGTRAVQAIRSQQNEDVGEWAERVFGKGSGEIAQRLLGVVDSVSDNIFAMGTGSVLSKDTQGAMRMVQLIMSGEATSNRMLEMLDKNMDPTEAALYSIGDGVIEWLTERYSLERIMGPDIKQLMGNKRALASFVARSMGAEGSEEIASDLLNMVLDDVLSNIYGHENEIQQRYDELVASGMGDREATQQALMEKLNDIGWSFLAGSLSGGLMAGGRVVMNSSTERALGKHIQKSDSNVQEIISSIKGMSQETESYKLADELSKKLDNGKKLNNYDVGRLAQLAMMESDEQIRGKVHNIVKDRVSAELQGNSEQAEMAEIITKALEAPNGTEALTKEERRRLNANHDALQIYYKYNYSQSESRQELKKELQEGTKAETKVENSIAEAMRTRKPTRGNINITKFATEEDIQRAEEQSQRTNSPREVIVDGKFANVQRVKVEKINGSWKARIQLQDGRTVETSQLLATNYGVANIINQAAINPEFFSEKYTNLLLQAQEEGRFKDIQKALDEAARIRIAAYIGKQVPQTSLDKKLANQIWMQSAMEHADNTRRDTGKLVKGTVKFKGLEYGTEAYNKAVSELEPSLRNAVDYVGSIFHAAGLELDMDDMQDPGVYGTYDPGTQGITINLFGQNFTLDGKADTPHNIVVTAGHELTHWLKDNAPAAYKRLEQYVMQSYAEKDYNELIKRLNHFMYQDGLDLEGAIDEIVANSSDQVLGDEETVNHIKQTDAKLFGQIRSFVQNLVEKMKAAIFGMQESASKDARFMLAKGVNRINKLWTGAWDEALSRVGQETKADNSTQKALEKDLKESDGTETHYGDNKKFSKVVTDPDELAFLNNQKTITTYKTMQLIDGKLYPPMAAIIAGNKEDASQLGKWEKATEHPELIKKGNMFNLNKGKGQGTVPAAYNPYMHSSNLMINDQFTSAYKRDNLVTVECEVPVSEENSGYHAELAKDSVGWHSWHTGTVAGQLRNIKGIERKVFLSRWIKPVRIVSDAEVAQHYADLIKNTDIQIPDNVVTPNLLNELKKAGVEIKETGKVQFSKAEAAQLDQEYMKAVEEGNTELQQKMVDQEARRAFSLSMVRDENGDLLKVYHGTNAQFNVFDREFIGQTGRFEGSGFNFTPYEGRASSYGKNVLQGYLNIEQPLSAKSKTISIIQLAQLIKEADPTGDNIISDYAKETRDYGTENFVRREAMTAARNIWSSSDNDVDIYSYISAADSDAESLIKTFSKLGYDGVIHYDDNGKIKTAVAFNSEQFKRSDPVTYDNNGKVIPLSERFDINNEDIRYSRAENKITEDSEGKELTKEQQEFFKDSKAVNSKGQLVKLYHGTTKGGFTEFIDTDDIGYFFTDDVGVASSYSDVFDEYTPKKAKNWEDVNKLAEELGYSIQPTEDGNYRWFENGEQLDWGFYKPDQFQQAMNDLNDEFIDQVGKNLNYAVYLNLENPLIIEGNGSMWNSVVDSADGEMHKWDELTDEQREQIAENMGMTVDELMQYEFEEDYSLGIPVYDTKNMELRTAQRTRDWVSEAADNGYDGVIFRNIMDEGEYGVGMRTSDVYVAMNPNQIKSVNNTEPTESNDIRYSRAQLTPEEAEIVNQAEENGIALDIINHTASKYSRASWRRSDYYLKLDEMAENLALHVLGDDSPENIEKAKKFIADINSISDYIGNHADILDYIASEGRSSWKSNPEYGGSIDSSTLCPKRWWQTGTIDAIQRELPDYALTAEDFLRIRNMMKERNYEVSCGLCFVESSRKNIAKYAKQFMNEWNSQNPDNKVNMIQINTVLGLEDTRQKRPEVYAAYEKFMNKLAQRKPKLFEMRAEYNNDILKHFQNETEEDKEKVKEKNKNGGIRINSFSDFEIVHLIDMMQVILDMANVGLAGQAYTKVREFAEALGPTGLKINMSMIAKGVDENGRIIFDEVEGMKWENVKDLRDKYADNVGTILVVFTEEQLMAAMADERIDFIIPFHRSQWNKSNYKDIGLPDNTKDFTYWQNERYRTPVYKKNKKGVDKKVRATNYMPNEYWDFNLSGKENAERYLEKCWKENKIPKFWKWLDNDGKGKFSLKADGSTDGYWKLLIDFKMYNHLKTENNGAPQMPVVPVFDMDACQRMLENYKGGHSSFPEAKDVVRDFVKEKKSGSRRGIAKKNGKITLAGNEIASTKYSKAEDEEAMDAGLWLATVSPWSGLQTDDERYLQEAYKAKRTSISLNLLKQSQLREKMRPLETREKEQGLNDEERQQLENMNKKLKDLRAELEQKEEELRKINSTKGFAGKMYQQRMLIGDYVAGRTQDQVLDSVENMLQEVEEARQEIANRTEELKEMANTQAVKTMQAYLNKGSLKQQADQLAETWQTSMPKKEIQDRLAAMALKLASGQDISTEAETLATDMMNTLRGAHNDDLESLRGVTLSIGTSLVNELKAENTSLEEMRQKIRGSGIKIIEGGEKTRLVSQWSELRNNNKSLPEISGPEIDVLHKIVEYISGQMKGMSGEQIYGQPINMEEVTAAAYVAAASVSLNMVKDPAAKRLISGLMKQIKELSQKQGEIVDNMTALNEKMAEAMSAGVRAKSWANVLQNDVDMAIKYYNEVAKLAAKEEKAKVRKEVAKHLKSENAKKLLKIREEYNQKLQNSRKARQTAEDIKSKRWWVDSQVKTLMKRLTEETDQKNIPEEAKPLARILCSLIVRNDSIADWRSVTFADAKTLERWYDRLNRMDAAFGRFDPDKDLDWLVIKAENPEDNDYEIRDKVEAALANVQQGLMEFKDAEGKGLETLDDRYNALKKVQDNVDTIYSVIMSRSRAFINGKRFEVLDLAKQAKADMKASKFKGERYGRGSRQKDAAEQGLYYGNLTPVYYFKNLHNRVMSMLYNGFEGAEDRSGLEGENARIRIAEIAEKYGYRNWDGQEKHMIQVAGGKEISITTEQLMALYATWMREQNMVRPEDSSHLLNGGFVLAEVDKDKGKPQRVKREIRPIRITEDQLNSLGQQLTEQQRKFVHAIVHYMSTDLAELGNEASMQVFGIKKYTEQYYFPIKSWGGVLNRSSANGITINKNDNRSGRQSFTKRISVNASNAVEIGDFTPTAVKHIVGMINYNTVFPAVEALNKVLNQQLEHGQVKIAEDGTIAEDTRYKQNIRAAFEEAYGRNALKYLEQFMLDINGGAAQGTGNTMYDKLLSTFKKNAVAGSLSVAFQQPMSYIRAAMLINPKYMAAGMKREKGAYEELLKYSGVAVLKKMGKFDMNYGRSMMEYITPEKTESKAKAAYEWASEKSTALPEKMDAWTWTRMWLAVKAEQHDMNPDMDVKSEAFLKKAAERFNELMRRTQVYDSVLVKSQNMRSSHWYMKTITSFMAEPTLTVNVLADAFQNIKEQGGKRTAAKAIVTFMLSAAGQAIMKAFLSAGRTPDKKKNALENYLYKLAYNLFNELNPFGLIPGYNQLVDTIANGELNDNSMSVIAKAWSVIENIQKMAAGQGNWYRNIEDSMGQFVQLATNIPAKNIMRDFRAMVNWLSGGNASAFTGNEFAQRATSGAVIKYQTLDTLLSEDILGIINNELLGSAGYGTTNAAYHKRLYEAKKNEQTGRAKELEEYLTLGKGVKDETITENLKKNAKADESLTPAEQDTWMIDNDLMKDSGNITTQYKEGKITKEEAKKLYKKLKPELTENDLWWKLDQLDYNKETGGDANGNDRYYRLKDAINANKTEKINKAIKDLLDHGVEAKKVKDKLSDWKSEYLEGDTKTRTRIRDALQKAYKALGLKASDADKTIEGWKKTKKK